MRTIKLFKKLTKLFILFIFLTGFAQVGFGQTTVSYDFSAGGAVSGLDETSPGITLDANIGFGSFKNGGTADPVINSGQLRLYQNATKGGSIKIYASNGVTITKVVVHASGTTGPAAYTVDGGSATNLSSSTTYTMSGLSATSEVEFYQKDGSSSNRIYVDDFEVTYTSAASCSAEPTAQATDITISNEATTSMDVSWTAGTGGDSYILVAREGADVSWTPTDGVDYSAQTGSGDFSSATDQGSGNKVVYSGSGVSMNLTGLNSLTTYHFQVFIFCANSSNDYYTSTGTNNDGSQTGTTTDVTYCDPGTWSSGDSEIENVTLNGENNNISNNTTNSCTNSVQDYTAQSADLIQGSSYTLTVEFGDCDGGTAYDGYGGVWIDWNKDGDFDDTDENIGSVGQLDISTGNKIENFTINVPVAQAIGNYRMRIVQDEGSSAATPCNSPGYGSIEDYTIEVIVNGPTITVSPSTLTGFTYVVGNGPSAEQSFNIEGSNLTNNITLTPPTNYEISTGTGGSFVATNPITLTQSGGTVNSTPIYVRLKSPLAVGSYDNEDIVCTSTGATDKNVTCSGDVTAVPTIVLGDNSQIADANVEQSTLKHTLSKFTITVSDADATFDQIDFTSTGTYDNDDITKFQLWYHTANDLSAASQLGTDITAPTSGPHSFSSLAQTLTVANGTYYFWITADIAPTATVNNTISVSAIANADITVTGASKSGSVSNAGIQTIILTTSPIVLFYQDFGDDGGDWSYTANPAAFHVSSVESWSVQKAATHSFGTIPSNGTDFWYVSDLNSANGTSGWGTLTFDEVTVTNYKDITIQFEYDVEGFDTDDDIKYQAIFDGVAQAEVVIVDGVSDLDKNGAVSISVPDGTDKVSFIISVRQNGADYGGLDYFRVMGKPVPTGEATITAGAFAELLNIDPLDDTAVEEFGVFDFKFTDDNTDADPLSFSALEITQATGNDVADWTNVIANAKLVNDDNATVATGTINSDNISFSGFAHANSSDFGYISANDDRTYKLVIYFKTDMGLEASVIDGKNLVFEILKNNVTLDASSSLFAANEEENSGSTLNIVNVTATKLAYVTHPVNTTVNTVMSPNITVEVVDENGNRDLDDNSTVVSISSSGTMDPISNVTLTNGVATFGNMTHTVVLTAVVLTISDVSSTFADEDSNTFDIVSGPQVIASGSFEVLAGSHTDKASDWTLTSNGGSEDWVIADDPNTYNSGTNRSYDPGDDGHDATQYLWFYGYNETGDDWAISKSYDCSDYTSLKLTFYSWKYGGGINGDVQVKARNNDEATPTWVDLTATVDNTDGADPSTAADWTASGDVVFPSSFDQSSDVQIAFYITNTTSSGSDVDVNWAIDDYEITGVLACTAPTVSATSLTFDNISSTQIHATFTGGNGEGRIVVVKEASAVTANPVDGTTYTANATFGSGTDIGTNEFVVYAGAGDNITVTGLTPGTTYYFSIFEYNNCSSIKYFTTEKTGNETTLPSGSEINVNVSGTDYIHTSTYDFGDVEINKTTDVVFTVENLGDVNLTFDTPLAIIGADYSTTGTLITSPIAASSTDDFTIRFAPTAIGTITGSVTLENTNDPDEGTYTIYFTGKGVGSNTSDIVRDATANFDEMDNIDYINYQSTNIINDANDIQVAQFVIRDGGGVNDDDALATELTDITFDVLNWENIRRIAIYDGITELGEVAAASSISFSGLSLIADDNDTKTFSLRASFNSTVTDGEHIQFTVTSTTSNSTASSFASVNAGGAQTSIASLDNRINVVASQIVWGTQPVDGNAGYVLDPFTIHAVDVNGNTDIDESACSITLSSNYNSEMLGEDASYTFSNGVVTVDNVYYDVVHNTSEVTITATASSCLSNSTTGASNTFKIVGIVPVSGDFRTKTDAEASGATLDMDVASTWSEYDGSNWSAYGAASGDGTPSATNNVYIRCKVNSNNSDPTFDFMTIMKDGYLTVISSQTESVVDLTIQNEGTLEIINDFYVSSSGNLIVEDGGTLILNAPDNTVTYASSIWQGTENFYPNSNLIIKNWDEARNNELLKASEIDANTHDGYTSTFGNIIVDTETLTANFVLIDGGVSQNLAHGDLTYRNCDDNENMVIASGTVTSGIGGDFIIESTLNAVKIMGITSTGDLNFTVNGDFIMNGSNDMTFTMGTSTNTTTSITIKGDMEVHSGIFDISTTDASGAFYNFNLAGNLTVDNTTFRSTIINGNNKFNFNGTTVQEVNIVPQVVGISMFVKAGATVQLTGDHLQMDANSPMTIESGASLQVNAGKFYTQEASLTNNAGTTGLVLQSNNSGTGSLIHNTASITATVQRYLPGSRWSFIFAPLDNIDGNILNSSSKIYSYNESSDDYWGTTQTYGTYGWTEVTPNPMSVTEGYVYDGTSTNNKIINLTGGSLDINDKTFNLSYTTHSGSQYIPETGLTKAYTDFDGWNLIGNPFASAIDWNQVQLTNVDGFAYYYDGSSYKCYSAGSGAYYNQGITTNGGSRYIPAGQGVFVKASNNTATVEIPAAARVHNTQTFWKGQNDIVPNIIRLNVSQDDFVDETIIRTLPDESNVTESHDGLYDAYKMFSWDNSKPQLYSLSEDLTNTFTVNSIPEFTGHKVVPLGLFIGEVGEYTINMTENNFDNMHVWLEDRSLSVNTNLLNTANYTFNQTAETNNDRFYLHFGLNTVPTLEVSIPDQVTNVNNEYQYYLPVNMFADADFEDVVINSVSLTDGSDLPTWLSYNLVENKLEGTPNAIQVLNLRVSGTDIFGATVYDDFKLEVKSGASISELNKYSVMVYPNPTNGVFTVKINNSDKTAIVSISTITGKVLKQVLINKQLSIDLTNFAKGIYFIDVKIDGKPVRKKIVIQ